MIGASKIALASAVVIAVLSASPALADQYKMAADNARVDCIASREQLTRISFVGDEVAGVTKVSSGSNYTDFSVVNEPVRGDIYLSVPETFPGKTLNFFAVSKKGFVYKFVCAVASVEAQQVFLTNPQLRTDEVSDWENETTPQETATRLIQAMFAQKTIDGYEIRQPAAGESRAGPVGVRLVAEYRGAAFRGKVLRLENHGREPLTLTERDVSPSGAIAVSLAQTTLRPGEATTAYVVDQNGDK